MLINKWFNTLLNYNLFSSNIWFLSIFRIRVLIIMEMKILTDINFLKELITAAFLCLIVNSSPQFSIIISLPFLSSRWSFSSPENTNRSIVSVV